MELSYFLAQLIGLSVMVFAIAGILRPRLIRDAVLSIEINSFSSLLFGFVGIVVGLAIILSHNIWQPIWVACITFVGWAALFKGITFLLKPEWLLTFGTSMYKHDARIRTVLFLLLLVGAYVAYHGFGL
jgi:hypothetical protein